jgi:myo-inositol-1(or 4)-monophosphatase
MMNLQDDLKIAVEVARGAAVGVLEHYGKVARLTKRQDEAVSEADRISQRFIVAGLKARYPTDGIVGEENDTGDAITYEVTDPAGRNWVIDPIDGTNNYLGGLGIFAVSIGLLVAGEPVLGVVHDVTRGTTYAAARGQGAWLDDRRIKALESPMGNNAILMLTSNLLDASGKLPAWAARWFGQTDWKIRILGSAALEAAHVARGVAHAAITLNGKLWDVAAPAAIVLEAGGVVTHPNGKNIFPFNLRGYTGAKVPFLAAGKRAHAELLAEINR